MTARAAYRLVDQREQGGQRQVLAPEDVALPDDAALQRQHVAVRHVIHMHDAEAGIEEPGCVRPPPPR